MPLLPVELCPPAQPQRGDKALDALLPAVGAEGVGLGMIGQLRERALHLVIDAGHARRRTGCGQGGRGTRC